MAKSLGSLWTSKDLVLQALAEGCGVTQLQQPFFSSFSGMRKGSLPWKLTYPFTHMSLGNSQGESWLWSNEAPLGYFKSDFCQTNRAMLRAQFTWHVKFRPAWTFLWGEVFVLVALWIQRPAFTCKSWRALQKKEALQFLCMDACAALGEWGGLCGASITEKNKVQSLQSFGCGSKSCLWDTLFPFWVLLLL